MGHRKKANDSKAIWQNANFIHDKENKLKLNGKAF